MSRQHQNVAELIVGFQDGQRMRLGVEPGTIVLEVQSLNYDRVTEYRATLTDGQEAIIPGRAMVAIIYQKGAGARL